MDIKYCEELINRMEYNIDCLKRMRYLSFSMCEKMFYERLIRKEESELDVLKNFLLNIRKAQRFTIDCKNARQQSFTLEELAKYDGKNGAEAYVAIDGIVYDVTYNAAWAAGSHFGLRAGKDLSNEISKCHNKEEILKGLTQVGIIKNN